MPDPLYKQIIDIFIADITAGRYKAGDKLPTEEELSKKYYVSRITAKRVLDELKLMGYVVRNRRVGTSLVYNIDEVVRSSAKETGGRNLVIGFIMPFDSKNYSASAYINGFADGMGDTNYLMALENSRNSHQRERAIIEKMRAERFDGIILYPSDSIHNDRMLIDLREQAYPIVLIDKSVYDVDCDCVTSDNYGGARSVTEYLISRGHRDIAFLSEHEICTTSTLKQRYHGYSAALSKAGIKSEPERCIELRTVLERVDDPDYMSELYGKYGALAQNLMRDGVTAIQCGSDLTAFYLFEGCARAGIKLPDELSVCGFDGINCIYSPRLTTYSQDMYGIGRAASELLKRKISDPLRPVEAVTVGSQLIGGGSVKEIE